MKNEVKPKGIYLGLPKCNGDVILKEFTADKNRRKNQIVLGEAGEGRGFYVEAEKYKKNKQEMSN